MFNLNLSDVLRGLISAVIGGALMAVFAIGGAVFGAPDFNAFTLDWAQVGMDMVNAAIVGAQGAFMGYLGKNFLSDKEGKLLGRLG